MIVLEDYLDLEFGLAQDLLSVWEDVSEGVQDAILGSIEAGDYDGAKDIIKNIDLQLIAQKMDSFVRRTTYTSLAFGAMLAKGSEDISYKTEPVPDIVEPLSELYAVMVATLIERVLEGIDLIGQDLEISKSEEGCCGHDHHHISKAEKTLAQRLDDVVMGRSKSLIDINANLNTSRLVSLGFLDEASKIGVQRYQMTSELDARVCPVCQEMHGKIFEVKPAKERVLYLLQQTDPGSLRTLAPFHSQSKTAIEELKGKDVQQLSGEGMNLSPYHPGCRCRPVLIGSVNGIVTQPPTVAEMLAHIESLPAFNNNLTKEIEGGTVIKSFFTVASADLEEKFAALLAAKPNSDLPVREVPLANIETFQPALKKDSLESFIRDGVKSLPDKFLPLVVLENGKYYIWDGNQRATYFRLKAIPNLKARVYTVT